MQQADSIQTNTEAGASAVVHKHYQLTPAQILSWYPKSYTDSQKDSVIQKFIKPSEIHWSNRMDTLHLPGHPRGKSVLDPTLPQYYKESFFSEKPYFHPEIMGGRQGVAGDPVPYSIAGDSMMSSLLLIIFLVTMFAISRSFQFISRQIKSFFYIQRGITTEVTETSSEIRYQLVLIVEACVLLAILFFFYLKENVTDTFTIEQSRIIELYTGIFLAYYIIKQALYSLVNWTFFDSKKNEQWNKSNLFLIAIGGVMLLPLVFVQSFFYIPMGSSVIYLLVIVGIVKILTFYKAHQIFFAQKGRFLQNILYFCTLELMPLLGLWGVLLYISEFLKINF